MVDGLSIVIPTINNEKVLQPLIDSIEKQECDFAVEIIVVNNAKNNPIQIVLKNTQLQLMCIDSLPGVNNARNLGLLMAKNEIVLFLDDDCRLLHPKTLFSHLERHRSRPELFAVGGGYAVPHGTSFFNQLYNSMQMQWLYSNYLSFETQETGCLIGGHFSIKKNQTKEFNIQFDASISYGGSEVSFFRDAHFLGLKMILLDFRVLHQTNENFYSLTKKNYKQGKNHFLSEKKHNTINFNYSLDKYTQENKRNVNSTTKIILINYFNLIYWWSAYQNKKQIQKFFKHFAKDFSFLLSRKRDAFRSRLLRALNKP